MGLSEELKPFQPEVATDEIQEEEKCKAQQYKRACQCMDGLSATQIGLGAAEGLSTLRESKENMHKWMYSYIVSAKG